MTQNDNFRYERKFIFNNKISNLNIESILTSSKLIFSQHFEDRIVNSIYFENKELSSIIENIDGFNLKKKIRLRWYGNSDIIKNPSLEIKLKQGLLNKKKIYEIENFDEPFIYSNMGRINSILKKKFKFLKNYSSISSTHYNRKYFISFNKLVRATIDDEIFYKKLCSFRDFDVEKNDLNKILEIKYSSELDNYIRLQLKNIKLRVSKNSKFVNSIIK